MYSECSKRPEGKLEREGASTAEGKRHQDPGRGQWIHRFESLTVMNELLLVSVMSFL